MSETSLSTFRLLKKGDEQAFREIYQTVFPYCASFVRNNKGDMEDARNIFQDCLIVLYENLQKEDFQLKSSLKSYLYGVARNLWLQKLRRRKKTDLYLALDDPDSHFTLADSNEDLLEKMEMEAQFLRLEKALGEHSPESQNMLRLFFYEKKNSREVAQELGYSDNYIRKKKRKCLASLRKKIVEESKSLEVEKFM